MVRGRTGNSVANEFGISRRTLCYWCKAALKYNDPEAQALRDILGQDTP